LFFLLFLVLFLLYFFTLHASAAAVIYKTKAGKKQTDDCELISMNTMHNSALLLVNVSCQHGD